MTDGELRGDPAPTGAPGARLRAARDAAGLTQDDVAARTRIPLRHIESIEADNYAALPSVTYAVGFARAYARAVGEDEVAVAAGVRAALAGAPERRVMVPDYEIAEGTRAPSRGLVLAGVVVALILVVGVGLYYGTGLFRGDGRDAAVPAATVAQAPAGVGPAAAPTPAPVPTPAGVVALVAANEVWVRVSDASDQTLYLRTMAPGDRYEVPAGTVGARLNVGRPDNLTVILDGRTLPPLGDGRRPLQVSLDPAALAARAGPQAAGAPAPDGAAAAP